MRPEAARLQQQTPPSGFASQVPGSDNELTEKTVSGELVPSLAHRMNISCNELFALLTVSPERKGPQAARRFSVNQCERLRQIAELFDRSVGTFGSSDKASKWLRSPNYAIWGFIPLNLLGSDTGIGILKGELEKIEHETFIAGSVF